MAVGGLLPPVVLPTSLLIIAINLTDYMLTSSGSKNTRATHIDCNPLLQSAIHFCRLTGTGVRVEHAHFPSI